MQVVLKEAQNLMDITNFILKNSKRDLVKSSKNEILSVDENFVVIKAGSFMMGSNVYVDEQPIHKVSIDYDFMMCKYQVTMKEYLEFSKSTDTHHPEWMEEGSDYNIKTGTNDHYKDQNFNDDSPIIGVSWDDAQAYCQWRSRKEGKTYRLPTEAEWEYSCRAGTTTKWSFGDNSSELDNYAWYDDNAKGKVHPVGDKKPNPWGLYDMHGNVWELCEDNWSDNYQITPKDGSANKSGDNLRKVLRGGSWHNIDYFSRSSVRYFIALNDRGGNNGFRVAFEGT